MTFRTSNDAVVTYLRNATQHPVALLWLEQKHKTRRKTQITTYITRKNVLTPGMQRNTPFPCFDSTTTQNATPNTTQ
jgi:hypothetical protein